MPTSFQRRMPRPPGLSSILQASHANEAIYLSDAVANNVCVECAKVWREENKDHLTELYREYKSKPENKKKHAERVKPKIPRR